MSERLAARAVPSAPAFARDFDALPLRRRAAWVVVLGSLTTVGALTIDLYLPAFPVMRTQLHASADAVQLTLTGTMVGLAIGQLIAGPLSDALGRRRPLVAGLLLHMLASLGCAAAPSIDVLAVMRVLQGAGMAASGVVALAMVRDRFDGNGAARLIARLMLIIGVSPVFAPTVGSALLPFTGWRGIFFLLGAISLVLCIAVMRMLPETLPVARRRSVGFRATGEAYREVLADRPTVWVVLVAGLSTAGLFGYVAGSSFVFQQQFHLSGPEYGVVFAIGGICVIIGSQVSGSLLHRYTPLTLLTVSLVTAAVASLVLLVDAGAGWFGLAGTALPAWAIMAAFGIGQPTAPAIALERHTSAAGTMAAVLGAVQFTVAAVAAPAVSAFGLTPALGMAVVVATGAVLALAVLLGLARPGLLPAAPKFQRRPREADETEPAPGSVERGAAGDDRATAVETASLCGDFGTARCG